MTIRTEKIFDGVSKGLIENAKIELETEMIIEREGLGNKETGKLDYEASYEFFNKNYKSDLTVYKQSKNSGYDLIVLYKRVAIIGIADFMTTRGKKMEAELPVSQNWPVYQAYELKRKVLCNLFDDPWDNRRSRKFKPSINKIWEMLEKCIVA